MTAGASPAAAAPRPYTLVAELTYRCPLRCLYCSNPVRRPGAGEELTAEAWCTAITQAEALGVVQLHLTGGEPLLRDDLESIVAAGRNAGLYTNLITSGVPVTRERLAGLARHGLDAIQISLQGVGEDDSERIAGGRFLERKLDAAEHARSLGLPLTLNVVLHRENLDQTEGLIALAERLGADRLELANTQYLGWALENRPLLLPSVEQLARAREVATRARERLSGTMDVLFVLPDYFAGRPRACMSGWGNRYIVVSPDGLALPCHQATSIPELTFERVTDRPLTEIWNGPAFSAFRGETFLEEPCRSCEHRHQDFGGCRCQAFALTGNAAATDPACQLAPTHGLVQKAREHAPSMTPRYRRVPMT